MPVPGPWCALGKGLLVASRLQTYHPRVMLRIDPCPAVPGLEGPCLDVAHFVKEALVLSLPLLLALELRCWHAGSRPVPASV